MKRSIKDYIDFERVDALLEGFQKSTGFVTAIVDLNGNILSKSGWRRICTEFHRDHPETAKNCTLSDTILANKTAAGEKYYFYQCLNGIVDVAIPIIIKGEHLANLFTGQFLLEKPDISAFRQQAKKYGFDEEEYLSALRDIPIVTKEKVLTILEFLQLTTKLISDMTLQKMEHAQLLESEQKALKEANKAKEKLAQTLGRISDGFGSLDHNWNYTFVNEKLAKNVGKKREELLGHNIWEVFPEAIGTPVHQAYLQAMEEQKSIDLEHFYPHFGRWFQHRFYPSSDGLSVFSRDITKEKTAEAKTREKDLQFRKLSANVPDLIFQFTRKPDGSYYVPVASEGIRNIFGCTPDEVTDNFDPIAKVLHPDDAERIMADIEYSAKHLSYFTCEFRVLIPGKPVQWIFSRSNPERLPDGSITWYGFNANITQRKEAEEKVQTLNQQLHLLVEAIQKLSIASSMEDVMKTVRQYVRKLLNADGFTFVLRESDYCYYADEEAISPLFKGQRFPINQCVSGWVMLNQQSLAIPDIYSDPRVPVEVYRPTFVKSMAMAPIRTIDPLGAIGIYWSIKYSPSPSEIQLLQTLADATAKAVENVQLIEGLESSIDERTAQLKVANKELEAFSYSVSHDLRAPLRYINGYVDLLNSRFRDNLPEKALHYLETITDAAKQMGTLIDDLLQFSRTGRQEVHKARLNMTALINEVLEKNKTDIETRNIKVSVQEMPEVFGDYSLLKQVWINLIENAVKYTRLQKYPEIAIEFEKQKGNFIFSIRDNGVGFDMKYVHKLFGVFQRLHSQSEFEGTGIGLANIQRIIQKHNGQVWAEGEPDKGATFFFSLPQK